MWLPFRFDGQQMWCLVDSREKWQEVLIAHSDSSVEDLKRSRIKPNTDIPDFGFYPKHTGKKTLGEWAKENGVNLDLDPTSLADLLSIDEKPRYGYTSKEIRTIKRRAMFGRQDEKYREGIRKEDLAILGRTLPRYYLDQFKKLCNKPNLSDQSRIVNLRIILRKVLRSRIISNEITLGQIRQFIDTGSPLSVMNIVTRCLENIVAKEGTRIKES